MFVGTYLYMFMGYILIIWHMYTVFDDQITNKHLHFLKKSIILLFWNFVLLCCSQHAPKMKWNGAEDTRVF